MSAFCNSDHWKFEFITCLGNIISFRFANEMLVSKIIAFSRLLFFIKPNSTSFNIACDRFAPLRSTFFKKETSITVLDKSEFRRSVLWKNVLRKSLSERLAPCKFTLEKSTLFRSVLLKSTFSKFAPLIAFWRSFTWSKFEPEKLIFSKLASLKSIFVSFVLEKSLPLRSLPKKLVSLITWFEKFEFVTSIGSRIEMGSMPSVFIFTISDSTILLSISIGITRLSISSAILVLPTFPTWW